MAKHITTCSSCGRTLEVEAAPGERVVCGECEATVALPGGAAPPSPRSPQGSGGPPADVGAGPRARPTDVGAGPRARPTDEEGQPRGAAPTAKADAADPLLGQCLGPFEIVGLLGRGGMGGVYRARQASLDRFVALKVLAPALAADPDFLARFEREARAAAAIHHPHIIRVYSVGQERGYQYIAMELVEGESLAEMLARERQLAPERALGLLKQVTGALAEAHACGIVHRDIKPSNILVTPEDVAKVADFGLAKRQASDVTVTHTGTTLGTPLYMAPEVGRGQRLDARSDLYSLGATFYHLLAGRPPFQAETAPELIVKHASELPPPLGAVAPQVDPRLSRLIDQLLCKHPEERVASAKALLGRLEALGPLQTPDEAEQAKARAMLLDSPTLALSPGRRLERQAVADRLRKELRPRRNVKTLIAAAGALVLLTAVVLLVGGVGRKPSERAAKPASPSVERERNAQTVFERAQAADAVGQWAAVLRELAQLDRDYADTRFCATRKEAIADLRAKAEKQVPREELPPPPKLPEAPGEWVSLFDGKTLDGWRVPEDGDFAKHGEVRVENGQITLQAGDPGTGIAWQRELPTSGYEVAFEAMRAQGQGDFGSVVFPVGRSTCSLCWGGGGAISLG